jgi:LacI family transcriptional regulator
MPARGPTDIRAVARRARVSTSTVSRFLNGKKRVSAATERRILSSVAALGYAPNRVARSLRLSRTSTLGMLIPDNSNPFFSGLVRGAEDAARAAGFALMLFNTAEDREQERAHLETLQALRCDGVLLIAAPAGPGDAARWAGLGRLALPVVAVDRAIPLLVDTVVADNADGGAQAARHLLGLGHRRIGLISVDYDVATHRARRDGFARALAAAGVARRPEHELRVPLTVHDGRAAAVQLLATPSPPTALFVTSNALSIGAVAGVQARGLRCPDDVAVVGYDSYDWQEVFRPRLTTIEQPAYLMGQRAAALLTGRITGSSSGPPVKVVLDTKLVVRESAGARAATARRGRAHA